MNKLLGALACLFPMFAAAADYSSTLVVQTGLLVESDLVVRNITDLASKKTCLAFYVRTPGTSSVIDCYDVIGDFGTTVRQVGHIKADEVIIRKIEDVKNNRVCLVAYVGTAGTAPAVDCYTTTSKFKELLQENGHLREGDLDVRRIQDSGANRTCLVAYVKTKNTAPSVFCYASQLAVGPAGMAGQGMAGQGMAGMSGQGQGAAPQGMGGNVPAGGLQQTSFMKEGDLVVRKISDYANRKACMVTYVSTEGTSSNLFCFDE